MTSAASSAAASSSSQTSDHIVVLMEEDSQLQTAAEKEILEACLFKSEYTLALKECFSRGETGEILQFFHSVDLDNAHLKDSMFVFERLIQRNVVWYDSSGRVCLYPTATTDIPDDYMMNRIPIINYLFRSMWRGLDLYFITLSESYTFNNLIAAKAFIAQEYRIPKLGTYKRPPVFNPEKAKNLNDKWLLENLPSYYTETYKVVILWNKVLVMNQTKKTDFLLKLKERRIHPIHIKSLKSEAVYIHTLTFDRTWAIHWTDFPHCHDTKDEAFLGFSAPVIRFQEKPTEGNFLFTHDTVFFKAESSLDVINQIRKTLQTLNCENPKGLGEWIEAKTPWCQSGYVGKQLETIPGVTSVRFHVMYEDLEPQVNKLVDREMIKALSVFNKFKEHFHTVAVVPC